METILATKSSFFVAGLPNLSGLSRSCVGLRRMGGGFGDFRGRGAGSAAGTGRVRIAIRVPRKTESARLVPGTEEGGRFGTVEVDRRTIDSAPDAPTAEAHREAGRTNLQSHALAAKA
jgi:hypothetical protein